MFDLFTEEIEIIIKDGLANLYWYKADLHKAWLRSKVDPNLCGEIGNLRDEENNKLSKRQQMDQLYLKLRESEFNRKLEVSRNFVRILIEHKNFAPQDRKHKIETAERAALKLKDLIAQQKKYKENNDNIRERIKKPPKVSYYSQLAALQEKFKLAQNLEPQKRGYLLEEIFPELMKISGIPVESSFSIKGEQIDGAIKYDGHYYLIELKWTEDKVGPKDIASFYFKVEGKMDSRGLIFSMAGFTGGVIEALPRGKDLKVLLLDGMHFTHVIFGQYTFQELLEYAVSQASLKANIYCKHDINS